MVVIDASVWVARFKKDDKYFEQAENIIRSVLVGKETICLPAIAFTEVAGVIKRSMKDSNAAWEAVYHMKDMKPKVFGDFDRLEPIATEMAIKYSIKGMDAYYLAVAELTKSKLHTFDQQQEEAFEAISKAW